jgi:hypothetical protein
MPRGRRSYVRIPNQILHDDLTNDQLATMVRLQAHMSDEWARRDLTAEQACTVRLTTPMIKLITSKGRRDVALKLARSLAQVASMSASINGDIIEIFWPKWAEFQGLKAVDSYRFGASSPSPSPSPSPKTKNSSDSGMKEVSDTHRNDRPDTPESEGLKPPAPKTRTRARNRKNPTPDPQAVIDRLAQNLKPDPPLRPPSNGQVPEGWRDDPDLDPETRDLYAAQERLDAKRF